MDPTYIILKTGEKVLIDKEDLPIVSKHSWYMNSRYPSSTSTKDEGYKNIQLHRFVIDVPKGMQVDHINRNRFDCRKSNLRICTQHQNSFNHPKQRNNTSGYIGVYWYPPLKKWQASIRFNRKNIHLGYFNQKIQAAKIRDKKAFELFGEFANLNFKRRNKLSIHV